MRLSKSARALGCNLDYQYTKQELAIELWIIKIKLIFLLIISPIAIPCAIMYFLYRGFAYGCLDESHPDYNHSFFENLSEDIGMLINPPKVYTPSSTGRVLYDSQGRLVQDVDRYLSNPNGRYRGVR